MQLLQHAVLDHCDARFFGIDSVAHRLPILLYFMDLILLYFLALRLWKRVAGGRPGWLFRGTFGLNLGHVAVFVFATNIRFFRFTCMRTARFASAGAAWLKPPAKP